MHLEGFEHGAKVNRILSPDTLRVSTTSLRISSELFVQFGQPRRVEIFYNRRTHQLMLRRALDDSRTAYAVKQRNICIRSLRKRLGFPIGQYFGMIQNGALIATYEEN